MCDVVNRWQFGESGIDVVDSWPCVITLQYGGRLVKVVLTW